MGSLFNLVNMTGINAPLKLDSKVSRLRYMKLEVIQLMIKDKSELSAHDISHWVS